MSAKSDKLSSPVRGTGGQVDAMVMALIEAAFDKDTNVREVISSSLCDLGTKHPALVLSSCNCYLTRQPKLTTGHRSLILSTMEKIIRQSIDNIDSDLAHELLKQASVELTQSKDVVPEWQTAASNVLVAISRNYCNDVMRELLEKFQPGALPHFFVVQTLANMATANVFGMVPFIKVCLGTMLPMLGMAKQDNMRWVLTHAVAKFCEAIVEYMANKASSPDPSLSNEYFAGEVFAAWEIFFNVWLSSKETKVRGAVVEALGRMSYVMSPTKLQECLPKLIPGILALYKKHQDQPFVVTEGLCMVLDAATQANSPMLEPFIDLLLATLFAQICQPIDYRLAASIKNHNELLRCFAVLAKVFSNRLVALLLQKLEPSGKDEKVRIAVLLVIRHLVNAAGSTLEGKEDLLLSGLKTVLLDPNNKVKKVLSQTIIAMAHHSYLEREGGHLMIDFVVKQCTLPSDNSKRLPTDADFVSNDALRSMCENVLQLLSTTVDNMDIVLWPYLLELLVVGEYSESLGSLCRSIHNVASRKRTANDAEYNINFTAQANVPKPPELLARLIVVAGYPLVSRGRGIHVLNAMQSLGPLIHPSLEELWDSVLPKLCTRLEEHQQSNSEWSQKSWEDLILKLLSKSLDQIQNETWISECGDACIRHIPLCTVSAEEKNFLFKCLGALMRKITKKEVVNKLLDAVFANVKHSNPIEREGCAITAGFVAGSHVDLVIAKLEIVLKNDARKSSSFLDFFKDSVNDSDEKIRATVMLCYGYVTLFAPVELAISRLETHILPSVIPQLTMVKDRVIKQNLIRSVELIGRAMHPDHLKTNFSFSQRNTLLHHMKNYVKSESTMSITSETRALALDACSRLVKLDPKLSETELVDLIKVALSNVLVCSPEDTSVELYDTLVEKTVSALTDFMKEVFIKDLTTATFQLLLQQLCVYMKSKQDYERQRSLIVTTNLLMVYLSNVNILSSDPSHLECISRLTASLIPRCCDEKRTVGLAAVNCFEFINHILLKSEGKTVDVKDNELMCKMRSEVVEKSSVGAKLVNDDLTLDIVQVISRRLQTEQLPAFFDTLFDGLLDQDTSSVAGCAAVLERTVNSRGSECSSQVEELLSSLLSKICKLPPSHDTFQLTANVICCVASHHLLKVVSFLLESPHPWTELVVKVWQQLGQKKDLSPAIVDHMLDLLSRCQPYEELPSNDSRTKKPARRAFWMPFSVICSLKEMLPTRDELLSRSRCLITINNYERLLATLLTQSASMVAAKPPKAPEKSSDEKSLKTLFTSSELKVSPGTVAVDALRRVVEVFNSEELTVALNRDDVWLQIDREEDSWKGYTTLARNLSKHRPHLVAKLISNLNPVLSSLYCPQRVMATAVFAELIGQCCAGDMVLVEMLANSLLGRLVDPDLTVRMLCIRGLGNIANAGPEQVQKFCTMVLSAMMAGMDDKEDTDDTITLEAMSGLSKILAQVAEKDIQAILINIALRIRPCFEKENAEVRAAAFTLFGNLASFGSGVSREQFLEQIHTNFVSFLLHLNDPENVVKQACKRTLRQIGPLIGSSAANDMFQKHLLEGAVLHYGEFINDLSKVIICDFPNKVNNYIVGSVVFFKSQWSEIRSNAASLVGFLLGNMTAEQCVNISKQHVCSALMMLLKDPEPDVRIRAAEAISHLFNI